jgi:IS30 family transposase
MVKKRQRRMFTAAESAEVWDRWQRGEGLKAIGRVFGKTSSAIFAHLKPHGGIRPAPRTSVRGNRALRPKVCKLARCEELRQLVAARLYENWSPEQIAGWMKHTYPHDEDYRVSHETIYRSLFVQARGVQKKELQAHLRSGRAIRRSRHASGKGDGRGGLTDMISIRERPAPVEDRAVPGHWEGDLLCVSSNSYIVTLVERHSRYVLLAKVANRDSKTGDQRVDRAGEAVP